MQDQNDVSSSFEQRLAKLASLKTLPSKKKTLNQNCVVCDGNGYLLSGSSVFFVSAKVCSCCRDVIEEKLRIDPIIRKIDNARIPIRYLKAKNDVIVHELEDWLKRLIHGSLADPNLFLFGKIGSGKTHTACGLIFRFLERKEYKSGALYVPLYDFMKKLKAKNAAGFSNDRVASAEATKSFDDLYKGMLHAQFLVLDEVGQQKLTDAQQVEFFDLVDKRYSARLSTVFISNHCEEKSRSLNSKLLSDMIGERLASRIMSGLCQYFPGEDLRKLNQREIITEEEKNEFKMNAITYSGAENKRHIMNWLVRNPVFETVSKLQRQELTYVDSNGIERDRDRREPKERINTWEKGDHLVLQGPVCDHDDAKLYVELVHQLALVHKGGETGLSVEISYHEIADLMGLSKAGTAWNRIRRQLSRLTAMSIAFKNAKGNRWMGSLLSGFYLTGSGPQTKVLIKFNEFMIPFYRQVHLTLLGSHELRSLSGDAVGLYSFYSSHESAQMSIGFEKLFPVLDIPKETPKKARTRRVSTAIKNLKNEGVMSPETTIQNDIVCSHLVRE